MSASHRYEFDMQYFPLILVQSPARVDEDGIREMFARFDELYVARKRYALVMDTTATRALPSAKERKVLADLVKACADEARRWCVGTAMVVDSPLIRGVMTAVSWVAPSPTRTIHVATMKEAVDWCYAQLDVAGIELPPRTKRYGGELASPSSRAGGNRS